MGEFKINSDIKNEITNFYNSGTQLEESTNLSDAGISSLRTSVRFVEQHIQIMNLLHLYRDFLAKDTSDLRSMVEEVENADKLIGNTYFRDF